MRINGEAIYGTRPRQLIGERALGSKRSRFRRPEHSGQSTRELDAPDISFTRNKRGDVVKVIILGSLERNIVIKSPGAASATRPGKVENVEMFGCKQKLAETRSVGWLTVKKGWIRALSR